MKKLSITMHGKVDADVVYLVANDTEVILLQNETVGLLQPPEGKGLTDWNYHQGTDQDNLKQVIRRGTEVVLLMDKVTRNDGKVQKLIKALRKTITELGGKFHLPNIPSGYLVPEILDGLRMLEPELSGEDLFQRITDPETLRALADHDDPDTEEDENRDVVIAVYDLIKGSMRAVFDTSGEIYMVPVEGGRAQLLGATNLRAEWAGMVARSYGFGLGIGRTLMVEDLFRYDALQSDERLEVHERTMGDDLGSVYIDLGRKDEKCVKVLPTGWSLTDMPIVRGHAFIKTQGLHLIDEPEQLGGPEDAYKVLGESIRPLVNVSDEDWPLVVGWMVNHLQAERDMPFLTIRGTNNTGKSTASEVISQAINGGPMPDATKLPLKEDDAAVVMAGKKVSVFDNVSYIGDDMADYLCRVTYGYSHEKRKLRTDADTVQLFIKPSVIMNGITFGDFRPDLRERMVLFDLLPRTGGSLDREKEIKPRLSKNHPLTYGALLTLSSSVMSVMDEAPSFDEQDYGVKIRLTGYAKVLWSLDRLGITSGAVVRYIETLNEMAQESVDDPLLGTVASLIAEHGTYNEASQLWSCRLGIGEIQTRYAVHASNFSAQVQGSHEELGNAVTTREKLVRRQGGWEKLGVHMDLSPKQKRRERVRGSSNALSTYPFHIGPRGYDILQEARSANQSIGS